MAVCVGLWVYKFNGRVFIPSMIALVGIYFCIWLGTKLPVDLAKLCGIPTLGGTYNSAVVIWTVILFIYCFLASILPVWLMLQPRDFINANQLFVALGLSIVGVFAASLFGGADITASAPAIAKIIPEDAPPIWPFLFITVACGAVSGFHSLVSSGTSAKQLDNEYDALPVGYGGMLLEGALAVVVILACTAGTGMGLWDRNVDKNGVVKYTMITDAGGNVIKNRQAWMTMYDASIHKKVDASGRTVVTGGWGGMKMQQQLEAFVEGASNFLRSIGIPVEVAISLFATLVACFAATTIDTATRLDRYVIQELGAAIHFPPISNKYVATSIAVLSSLGIAVFAGPKPGSGGMLLWPIFGACNQILAGLGFVLVAIYLLRRRINPWFVVIPLILMVVLPAWAMCWNIFSDGGWLMEKNYLLVGFGIASMALTAWLLVEAGITYAAIKRQRPEG
ncbi:MAG TPA: carbon starvation CstA family protein, partial [Phycisphaerae bacterium]|nr:carbon starvation CstA family protein [Phycisphaerae bacterium]